MVMMIGWGLGVGDDAMFLVLGSGGGVGLREGEGLFEPILLYPFCAA